VADVDAEEPGERVQIPLAVRVLQVAAFAADDDRDVLGLVPAHAGEVHPEVLLREPLVRGCVKNGSHNAGRRLHLRLEGRRARGRQAHLARPAPGSRSTSLHRWPDIARPPWNLVLDVLPTDVVNAADRRPVSERAVRSVSVVVLEPVW